MAIEDKKYILSGGAFAFSCNLVLFLIKMYVGLASNSISIYSDGINNLFDSLSGVLAFFCFWAALGIKDERSEKVLSRTEDLLSFVMSVMVAFAGCYFAYNSLERFMYPTPVTYLQKYLYLIVGTTVTKLFMAVVFKLMRKKSTSPVLKVMETDSILDFFVSAVTVLTLVFTKNGGYAYDAAFGIVISIIIVVGAVKLVVSSVKAIIFN